MASQRPFVCFDNAATSFPKPESVTAAMAQFLTYSAVNPGRSGFDLAIEAGQMIDQLRADLSVFFNNPAQDPARTVFTLNASDALNIAIQGICHPGDHVVSTVMEHNSVLRPLHELAQADRITFDLAPCSSSGLVSVQEIEKLIRPETRLVIVNHASNVFGTIQPITDIGAVCRRHKKLFLVDCAQTAGTLPVDMTSKNIDVLVFTGHKGLLGPTGTGGLIVGPDVDIQLTRFGGTGVRSAQLNHLREYPWRLEVGTCNSVGLAGLAAGLAFVRQKGLQHICDHERDLATRFMSGCADIPGVRLHGFGVPNPVSLGSDHLAVISLTIENKDPATVGMFLDADWDIGVRTGLHCAPFAHAALGTDPAGTIRFSFGIFNTVDHIDRALEALADICS